MTISPALFPAVTVTVVRDRKITADRAKNQSDCRIRYCVLLEKNKTCYFHV